MRYQSCISTIYAENSRLDLECILTEGAVFIEKYYTKYTKTTHTPFFMKLFLTQLKLFNEH